MTEPSGPTGAPGPEYAGLVTRALAFALDVVIVQAALVTAGAVLALIVSAFEDVSIDISGFGVVAAAIGWVLVFDTYLVAFWTLTGQTPGMRALGIRVTTVDGPNLRLSGGVVRVVGMVLAAIPVFLGYLPILTSPRRQGLHDRMAGTIVRYVGEEPKPRRHIGAAATGPPSESRGTPPVG